MKKALLAVAITSLSTLATADDFQNGQDWYKTESGLYVTQGWNVGENQATWTYSIIYKTNDGNRSIAMRFISESCGQDFENTSTDVGAFSVNGQKVRYSMQCVGSNYAQFYPTTGAGADFVWSQFRDANFVTVSMGSHTLRFTAKGFRNAAGRHHKENNAL